MGGCFKMSETEKYLEWKQFVRDEELAADLANIEGNESEIFDRFFKSLDFGTAGLRGVLGAGTNRMNIYTVRQATQALPIILTAKKAVLPLRLPMIQEKIQKDLPKTLRRFFPRTELRCGFTERRLLRRCFPMPCASAFATRA